MNVGAASVGMGATNRWRTDTIFPAFGSGPTEGTDPTPPPRGT